MDGIRDVTMIAVIVRILAAVFLGGFLGMERGLKRRAAGLRTYMLVCVGACLIMLTNQYIYQATQAGDPVRMGAQVVSGIGFLGAGTIIVTRRNQIKGLTTAAGLWAAAGVGLALGIGFYEAAIAGSFAIFLVLTALNLLDSRVQRSTRRLDLYVELSSEYNLGDFLRQLREQKLQVESVQLEHEDPLEAGSRGFVLALRSHKRRLHAILLDELRQIPGVVHLEEL